MGGVITGGLSAEYHGIGASSNIGYTRDKSKTVTKIKGQTLRQVMTKTVIVPPKHKRRVAVVHRYQRKGCKARNIKVIFPKKAKFNCKVDNHQNPRKPKINVEYNPYISDLLNKHIVDGGADPLTARLEGKYVWVESNIELAVSNPQPIL